MLIGLSITNFLNETASNSPTPGGGSVSALAASLGTALVSMVCRLTISKNKNTTKQTEMTNVMRISEKLRSAFTAIIDEDTAAFNKLTAAFRLQKETDEQRAYRTAAIQDATKGATLVPLKLMELCTEAIELVNTIVERGNQDSLSDAGVAAVMISAGCEGAALNVKIHLSSVQNSTFVLTNKMKASSILAEVNASSQQILFRINEKFLS